MANKNPNTEHLRPFNTLTEKEHRKLASEGGRKSAEVRAYAKTFKEKINERLSEEDLAEIVDRLIQDAKDGNSKAVELLRDTRGEKPVEKAAIATGDTIEEALKRVDGDEY